MKTLSATIALSTIALIFAILAPGATSRTTDQARISTLESEVANLKVHAKCFSQGIPVTSFSRPGGAHYLGATRRLGQSYVWVAVIARSCMPHSMQPSMLGWEY